MATCTCPGGHVEFGEPAAVALRRELKEEAGLRAVVGPLLLTTEGTFRTKRRPHHEINLLFHVEHHHVASAQAGATPPAPIRSLEKHIAFEWVDLRSISRCDLRPSNIRDWLESWFSSGPTSCSTWNTAI